MTRYEDPLSFAGVRETENCTGLAAKQAPYLLLANSRL